MTLEDLDKLLASWGTDLKDMEAKLSLAENNGAYKQSQTLSLAPNTKTQVDNAAATLAKLWKYLKALKERFDQATEKRKNLPGLIGRQTHIDEIERLLTTEIVALKVVKASAGEMFGKDEVQGKTPPALKQMVAQEYAAVYAFFDKLRDRWLELMNQYDTYNAKFLEMKNALDASKPLPPELLDVEMRLKTIDKLRFSDPLGIKPQDIPTQLESYITKAQIKVQVMQRELEQVGTAAKQGTVRLNQVVFAFDEAKKVADQVTSQGYGADRVKRPESHEPLAEKLAEVNKAVEEKRFADASAALARFNEEASRLERSYSDCSAANQQLLQQKSLLIARWRTAKSKFQENKDKGLEGDKALATFAQKAEEQLSSDHLDLDAFETLVVSYETRMSSVMEAFAHRPPPTREETLRARFAHATQAAQAAGVASDAGLVKFAQAADSALRSKDLDTAETMITSYETRMANHAANGANHTAPQPAAPTQVPPASTKPRTRKEELSDRLAVAKRQAKKAGLEAQPALTKFAQKAEEGLASDDLDSVESMVHSYETKLVGLQAAGGQPSVNPKPAVSSPAPAASDTPKDKLQVRLLAAKSKAQKAAVDSNKALTIFATKAEEALASGDLETAESMVFSYETKVGQLTA